MRQILTIASYFLCICGAVGQLTWNALICSNAVPITSTSLEAVYYFTNNGEGDVRFIGGYSDCECQIVDRPIEAIKPGAHGKVVLKLDIGNEAGDIRRTAHLITDAKINGVFVLTNVVTVPELVSVSKNRLIFDRKNPIAQSVILTNMSGDSIRLLTVSYDSDGGVPIRWHCVFLKQGQVIAISVLPSPSSQPYNVQFIAVVQQRVSGVEKDYRFEVEVR